MNRQLIVVLVELIVAKSRERVISSDVNNLRLLHQKRELWGSKHFQLLAEDMGWSATNLKRLFGLPGHNTPKSLSNKSEKIICRYLEVKSWDELQVRLLEASTKQVKTKANGQDNLKKTVMRLGKKIDEIQKEFEQLRRFLEN